MLRVTEAVPPPFIAYIAYELIWARPIHEGSVPTLLLRVKKATGVVEYRALKDTMVSELIDQGDLTSALRPLRVVGYYRFPGSRPYLHYRLRPYKRARSFPKTSKLTYGRSFEYNLIAPSLASYRLELPPLLCT